METADRNFHNLKTWNIEDEIGVIGGKPKTFGEIFSNRIDRIRCELDDRNNDNAYNKFIKEKRANDENYSKIGFLNSKISELDHLEKTLLTAT